MTGEPTSPSDPPRRDPAPLVGGDPAMQRLLARLAQAARSQATVLLQGETGTGKELLAAALHAQSARGAGPYVRLNCAALSEGVLESELFGHERGAFTGATALRKGRLELAHRGTLFLDEVSELPGSVQVKLLRFLQEREIERVGGNETLALDVRIVAASNRDLRARVAEGRFREDLFYRLDVIRLEVPPLRERPSDVLVLADHFRRKFTAREGKRVEGFSEAARRALLDYPWPGNVRELQNAVERAVVFAHGPAIELEDLPGVRAAGGPETALRVLVPGSTLAQVERYAILRTLEATRGSTVKAAEILGIGRRTLQYRLSEWGLTGRALRRGLDAAAPEPGETAGAEPSPAARAEAAPEPGAEAAPAAAVPAPAAPAPAGANRARRGPRLRGASRPFTVRSR